MTKNSSLLAFVIVPAILLLVPLAGMLFSEKVQWTGYDFVVAYVLLAGAGFAYRIAASKTGNLAYRGAAGLAVAAGVLLIWINLAVGLIGSEDNPANLLYGGVLAIGLIGAAVARLESQGMCRALFAMAAGQFAVPIIARISWAHGSNAISGKGLCLNGIFVVLFVVSALLFLIAARQKARNLRD